MELNTIHQGNALDVQRTFPEKSIDMCMTSPPYWGLRDYGMSPMIWDGDDDCDHEWGVNITLKKTGGGQKETPLLKGRNLDGINSGKEINQGNFCQKCGAWKGQLGLEPTPDLYIKHLCDIFDETWRVLKEAGSLWVNIADSYGGSGAGQKDTGKHGYEPKVMVADRKTKPTTKFMPKSLVGIPERFVLEMMNRGWTRRNTIIWFKPNCMPTSAKDRFTVDFEYIYFFTKKKKYYFEQQLEKAKEPPGQTQSLDTPKRFGRVRNMEGRTYTTTGHKNKRCVWKITTKPFKGAHFAVFPEELCETPIKAGSPRGGICLDPFFGSGTVGVVARRLGRNYVGIELNPEYIKIANERLKEVQTELDVV